MFLKQSRSLRLSLVAIGMLAAITLSACGNSATAEPAGAVPSEAAPVEITVGETPGLPASYTRYGVEAGIFKKHGLDVKVVELQGGQTMVSALLAGSVQFTGGDVVSFTKFRAQNVPIVIARPGSGAGDKIGEDYQAIVAGSKITTPKDFEGATIGVNELNNVGQLFTEMALKRNHGVDPSKIKWAEISLPNVNAAIASGQIDAGYSLEPFQTAGNKQGLHSALTPGVEYGANSQIGLAVTSEKYLKSNPKVVEAFQAAHKEVRDLIASDEKAYRQALVKLAGLDPTAADTLRLPAYNEYVNRGTLDQVVTDMHDLGLIDKRLDTKDFYAPGA
jgi:NitT/TauT family transport system substrate-binding protein